MIKMVGRNIIQFHSRMWNLARSWNPLFFSRSYVSRDTLRMRTSETVGVWWRPFAFWFWKKKIKTRKWVCTSDLVHVLGAAFQSSNHSEKDGSSQAWNVSRLAQLRVVAGWVWFCVKNKLFVRRWHGIASVSVGENVQKWMEEGQNWNGKICWYSHPEDRKVYLIALDSLHENEMPKEH